MSFARLALLLPLAFAACSDPGWPGPGSGSRALVALKDGNAAVITLGDRSVAPQAAPAMAISIHGGARGVGRGPAAPVGRPLRPRPAT